MKYQFKEQLVTVKGEFNLAATLTVPEGIGGKMPAIVIVCGTGESDRDGNVKKPKMIMNIYKMLSDFFAEQGFVTIRYDKRGVCESKGDKIKTGMNDLVEDIISNVKYLKTLPFVNQDKIILAGHSEGAILTNIVNSRYPVAGLILIAGAGICIKTALTYQNLAVYEEVQHKKGLMGALLRKMITKKNALSRIDKVFSKVQASTLDVMRIQMIKFPAKWLREHLAYNDGMILELLRNTKCPVLAVTGDKDVQVNPEDLKAISALGKSNITCSVIPDMDHVLKEFTGEKSVLNLKKQYASEMDKPLNKIFLNQIENWLANNFMRTLD